MRQRLSLELNLIGWLKISFKEIPRLHPSVEQIIELPYRRWKKNLKQAFKNGEIRAFYDNYVVNLMIWLLMLNRI